MDILQKILAHKRRQVEEQKTLYPLPLLERSIYFESPCVSLKKYLLRPDRLGVIAEFKRRSPSRGIINAYAPVERTAIGYMQAGASALSVLTDTDFFGGKNEDLTEARKFNYCPILRKDFVVDEYQIVEAKAIGADAVLLLANVLGPAKVRQFTALARSLSLEVLLEIRDESELDRIVDGVEIVGVNNRDLRTFQTDVRHSFELGEQLPERLVKVSESGLDDPRTVVALKQAGFHGFLIGEAFMRHGRPERACEDFIRAASALLFPQENFQAV